MIKRLHRGGAANRKLTSLILTFLALCLWVTAKAQAPVTSTINISVQCLVGPSFNQLLQSYSNILKEAGLPVVDSQITNVNGYGRPCAGYIKYEIPQVNGTVEYTNYSLQPNCIWGDIFSKAQDYINVIKIQNARIVSFTPTSFNGYGKPCSASIGYVKQ